MKNTYRILADNVTVNNNTWVTGLNNNDVIVGPSGGGKTTGYVIPNILNAEESMIITDTKGNLCFKLGESLKKKGYRIIRISLKELAGNEWGYNPLDHIRYDPKEDEYNEQDIISIAHTLSPARSVKEPFWEEAAQMYLECLISYVMKALPKREHNLKSVGRLADNIGAPSGELDRMMYELEDVEPDCFTIRRYKQMCSNRSADKMDACIKGMVFNALNPFASKDIERLFENPKRIDFKLLGRKKTAVFLEVSDTDRSMDTLANLFYTQALQNLCREADARIPDCRLKVPVRFILDDFATNTLIPDFDKIISVIRSREIYVSLIIQSISQLESLYGPYKAITILNNCDNLLYLGGQDVETARYIGTKLNKTTATVLNLPLDSAFLFTRGREPRKVKKYNPFRHESKNENLPEQSR